MTIKDLNKIKNLIFFTRGQLETLFPKDSGNNIAVNVYRWAKRGEIFSLKNGFYITCEKYKRYGNDPAFLEFVSSALMRPSYLSLDYVLRKYDILAEATYGITAVTLKTGKTYSNKLGTFEYRKIKKSLFTGYQPAYFESNEYYIASKAKALFDWFYYRAPAMAPGLENRDLVEDLRLNLEGFNSRDWKEFKGYCNLAGDRKLSQIAENIIKNAPNSI
ncbi:MAG: hypothetical protein ABH814_01225 [bacterium]